DVCTPALRHALSVAAGHAVATVLAHDSRRRPADGQPCDACGAAAGRRGGGGVRGDPVCRDEELPAAAFSCGPLRGCEFLRRRLARACGSRSCGPVSSGFCGKRPHECGHYEPRKLAASPSMCCGTELTAGNWP